MQQTAGLAAFHRHFLVTPRAGDVSAWVEDDYHHMGVTLRHDGEVVTVVKGEIVRAPWSTCPGAEARIEETFTGTKLAEAARRGEKKTNCTHLHDLAVLAAAHAEADAPVRYEITVSDPVDGRRIAEISRDGALQLRIVEDANKVVTPQAAAGKNLFELSDWIASLDTDMREPARLLRWAAIIAHGRQIPIEKQSDATRMPPNCFTFQPERKGKAIRVGEIINFDDPLREPLNSLKEVPAK